MSSRSAGGTVGEPEVQSEALFRHTSTVLGKNNFCREPSSSILVRFLAKPILVGSPILVLSCNPPSGGPCLVAAVCATARQMSHPARRGDQDSDDSRIWLAAIWLLAVQLRHYAKQGFQGRHKPTATKCEISLLSPARRRREEHLVSRGQRRRRSKKGRRKGGEGRRRREEAGESGAAGGREDG